MIWLLSSNLNLSIIENKFIFNIFLKLKSKLYLHSALNFKTKNESTMIFLFLICNFILFILLYIYLIYYLQLLYFYFCFIFRSRYVRLQLFDIPIILFWTPITSTSLSIFFLLILIWSNLAKCLKAFHMIPDSPYHHFHQLHEILHLCQNFQSHFLNYLHPMLILLVYI